MNECPYNYASYILEHASDAQHIAEMMSENWVFRGQANTEWKIESSQEREIGRWYDIKSENGEWLRNGIQSEYESKILNAIKKNDLLEIVDRPEDDFSWLALLQHYGCKTRLVDFTTSFEIAMFFAVADCSKIDAAVWAINKEALDARISEIAKNNKLDLSNSDISRRLVNNSIELVDRYRDDENLAITYSEPEQSNPRLKAQHGLFLCPLNLNNTFMQNLTHGFKLSGTKDSPKKLMTLDDLRSETANAKIIKVIIPEDKKEQIIAYLRRKSVTSAKLFPDLEGFARSLNYFAMGLED